ncbi:MAG TPA: hypothetical protein VLG76_03630 [Rhabdochlamydiaceae bacterium]|nr:hypothetical protein [Rhabdochlamydiaceae bacterium]
MAKKILKKMLSNAKKGFKAKKVAPKAVMKEEVMPAFKKKKGSEKILTAEGWKRLVEKERKPALKK